MRMPKVKSHRGARKRFKKTKSGKIKRKKAFTSHIFTNKTRKRKRNLKKGTVVSKSDHKVIKQLIH